MSEPEDEDVRGTRRRQPYNRGACSSCSNAKTRCLPLAGFSRCERCEKLDRECVRRIPVLRKKRVAPATTTRVADLENKLDNIVNLLSQKRQDQNDQAGSRSNSLPSISHHGSSNSIPSPSTSTGTAQRPGIFLRGLPTPESNPGETYRHQRPYCDTPAAAGAEPQSFPLPTALMDRNPETQKILKDFSSYCLPYFPFTYVSPEVATADVSSQSPFFADVARFCVLGSNMLGQAVLGEQILHEVVDKIFLHPGKFSELLMGMLMYAAWNHNMFERNGQMTALIHLIQSLLVNMSIERPPGAINVRVLFMKGDINPEKVQAARGTSPRTLEERRALLAAYWLASVKCLMSGFVIMDSFEWNSYVEECCNVIEDAKQYPEDVAIAYMCRLQRISDSILTAFPRPETPKKTGANRISTVLAIKALQGELDTFKRSLPPELLQHTLLMLAFYATEVVLYETILFDTPEARGPLESLQVLELLSDCLSSVKSSFAIWRTIPHEHYLYLPFTMWIHTGLVMQTACKLIFFEYPGWDLPTIRHDMDIMTTLDHEIAGLDRVVTIRLAGRVDHEMKDIFQKFLRRKQFMKSAIEMKLYAEATVGVGVSQLNATAMPPPPPGTIPSIEDIYMGGVYNDFDDAFWKDFGNWNAMPAAYQQQRPFGIS